MRNDELTILSKSVEGRPLRGFRTIVWKSSSNIPNTSTQTFWIIRSNFKRHTYIKYLKLKVLFGNPTEDDLRCLLDLDEVFKDEIFIATLSVLRNFQINKEIVLERANTLRRFLGATEVFPNDFWTLEGTIAVEREERRVSIRRAKKYSGYVKNISALGTKRSSGSRPEPEIYKWNNKLSIDFARYLSVGEFSTGQPAGVFFTLTSTKSAKRTLKRSK